MKFLIAVMLCTTNWVWAMDDFEFKWPERVGSSENLFVAKREIARVRSKLSLLTQCNDTVLRQYDLFARNMSAAHNHHQVTDKGFKRVLSALEFATKKHCEIKQTRKDQEQTPYIIHPIGVANTIMEIGKEYDADVICGALLHDTVEDTNTTFQEIKDQFGVAIESFVREVTDDKTLEKQERKRLQIKHAHQKSLGAAMIKYGDKLYNLTDLLHNPPADWPKERIADYFKWAEQVVNNLPAANKELRLAVEKVIKEYLEKESIQ